MVDMILEGPPTPEPGEVTSKEYAETHGLTPWAARYRLEKLIKAGDASKRVVQWFEEFSTWNAAFGGVVRCNRRTAFYLVDE
jgi:hypothetical protein